MSITNKGENAYSAELIVEYTDRVKFIGIDLKKVELHLTNILTVLYIKVLTDTGFISEPEKQL